MKSANSQNLKINTAEATNQMIVQENKDSSVRQSALMKQMRSEMVKNRTYVRQKELRDGFKLSAESYRRWQKYQPEDPTPSQPVLIRTEQKSKSLAAHIRDIQSDIEAEKNKDLGVIYLDAPRMIRTGSKWDSIAEIRKLRMLQLFDHKKFNVFLASKFGQYLLEGIDDPQLDKEGITRVSQFIKEKKTYQKAQQKAKNDVCAIVKQSMVFSANQKTQAKVIDQKAPEYLQELQKLFNTNQFCKSAQKMFEFYHRKLQNVELTVDEQQRIQKVIVKELKQHTFVQSNKTLTVDQLLRRLEETGPDKLEIDVKKELKRWIIVMHVFQSFLMMMGLPWKEITLENLDKKMNILDKLTKQDLRKFMVDLRPELLDDDIVATDTNKPTKSSKMKIRIGRKNNIEKDDVYGKLMKQSAVVIQEIMNKRRRQSVAVTRSMVSPQSSKAATLRSDDQPTSLVNLALEVGNQKSKNSMSRAQEIFAHFEKSQKKQAAQKQVVFTEPIRAQPSQIIEESQSSLSSSSSTSESDEKPDPFANVVRVYRNPYAAFQENYIAELIDETTCMEKVYSSKKSSGPMYDPVVAMNEAADIKDTKMAHRKTIALKKRKNQEDEKENQQLTSKKLTEQLERINAIKEIEKQANLYDAETEKEKRMSKLSIKEVKRSDKETKDQNKREAERNSTANRDNDLTQSAKTDFLSISTKDPQKKQNRFKKQETLSINELQDQLRKQLSMGAKYYEELQKNQEFLKALPKQSRPKTVKVGQRNSQYGLKAFETNENAQTGETLPTYAGLQTPLQQSRNDRILHSATNQPNTRSAVFYRTQRVGSLAGKQSEARIISSGRLQKTSQEKRMDDQIKFAKILHENRVKFYQKDRVKSAVHGHRNQLQSFEQTNQARLKNSRRNSVTFATQEAPNDKKSQSGPGYKMDLKANRWLTEATSGHQSIQGSEETESQRTESVQRGDSVNIGKVLVNKTKPRLKSSAITIGSRKSQGSSTTKKLSGLSHYRNETTQRVNAMNEILMRNCDELAASCTQDTSDDVYDQHDELIKVIENMQEKNEIASNLQQLYDFSKVREEIQTEKQIIQNNYLGEEALKTYKKTNKEVSLYLFKMKKLTKEQKLWRAQPITINRISELGKILAAHS